MGPARADYCALVINRMSAEQIPDKVEQVKFALVDLMSCTPIAELLIEADWWAAFSEHLTHTSGKSTRDASDGQRFPMKGKSLNVRLSAGIP